MLIAVLCFVPGHGQVQRLVPRLRSGERQDEPGSSESGEAGLVAGPPGGEDAAETVPEYGHLRRTGVERERRVGRQAEVTGGAAGQPQPQRRVRSSHSRTPP